MRKISFLYHLLIWTATYPSKRKLHVMFDYLRLRRQKGLNMNEYYNFEFDKRSEGFRQNFLGENEQRYYLELLNPVKYYILARNKYLAHRVLDNLGVRKAELYCYYNPECRLQNEDAVAYDLDSVCAILRRKQVDSFVIKTTESFYGESVWVIKHITFQDHDALLERFDGKQVQLSEILGVNPLIFESAIHQTKQFSAFNESSVNTVRFMTALYPDGTSKITATFIKIGRTGKCVDNAGGGGNVDVCVDTQTGTIQHAIQYDGWRNIKDISHHPDNGTPLNGVVIDNWQQIKEEVLRFQQAFPYCKTAGWDIAITDEGPVVIEVNDMWDRTGQYFIRRGWRKEIRDCYLAWKNYYRQHPECFLEFGRLDHQMSTKKFETMKR